MRRGKLGIHPRQIRETADALLQRGIRPTVQRIRQMIGGSPNTIAPVLREWRETLTPEQQLHLPLSDADEQGPEAPSMLSDLLAEIWQRAVVFATIECKGSPRALQLRTLDGEAEQLRMTNRHLLDRLERETNENAHLKIQLADSQAMVKSALEHVEVSESRYLLAISESAANSQKFVRDVRRKSARKKVRESLRKPSRLVSSAQKLARNGPPSGGQRSSVTKRTPRRPGARR
jgi:hypothetical protein